MDDDLSAGVSDHRSAAMEVIDNESPLDFVSVPKEKVSRSFDHCSDWVKLEDEIDQTLQALRKSQEFEYNMVEERLHEQKNYLQNLYEQLDKEKSELAQSNIIF
ncbi:protein OBERON 1-like [Quillaja saponaria]|uniref:Protein OBERON 1-like n=1 Tax=Quillaja saponaria TaxID=32244 RepID=A0AAD7LB53_QUISA|nr:protein OBERON 1-like [Quillaja saponaria]